MEFGMVEEVAGDQEGALTLSLSLQPSPPRFQELFSCCYCPRKFRSSQALGGHQNAHKLQRNLARRGREAAASLAAAATAAATGGDLHARTAALGGGAGESAQQPRVAADLDASAGVWGGGIRAAAHYRHHLQVGSGGAVAPSSYSSGGGGRGNGELADEMIDLSLKL